MKLTILPSLLLMALGWRVSVLAQSAPYAHTQAVAPISAANATLNGMVVPNGFETIAWFEWGTNTSVGQTTTPVNVGSGFTVVRLSAGISNLPPISNFHCRLVASNSSGVVNAASVLFTSGQRVTQWGDMSSGLLPMPFGLTNVVAADNGYYHNMVLTTAGKVIAWGGHNEFGQTDVPAGLSNGIAVSAGLYHEAALKSDGRVVAWGRNDSGQTNVPAGLSNVVAISAGYYHTLALLQDGTLAGWGDNGWGQLNFPAGLSNVVAIAASGYSGLALRAEGTMVAWGSDAPVPEGISNVVAICGLQALALKSDGSVVVLGGDTNVPANLGKVVSVSSGYYHRLALNETGKVFAWGIDPDYRGITNVPPGLNNAVAIAGDGYHSLALGNLPPQAFAQHITGVAGQDQTIVLTGADANNDALRSRITTLPSSGTLYQWTAGGRGDPIAAPDTLVADTGNRVILSQPAVADDTFAFTMNDGLQDSSSANVQVEIRPASLFTQRPQPAGVSSVTFCGNLIAAVPTKAWFEWGAFGGYGQSTDPLPFAGDGSLIHVTTLITNLAERANYQCRLVVSNEFGVSYGMPVLFTTGRKLYGWGSNGNGQLNIATNLTNVVFTAAGWHNSFAIRADGTALGWGWNSFGQATPPAGLSNAVDIAAGYFHGLALQSDGMVVAWGNNDWGQTNVPPGLSNVVEVSAGYGHSLALKSDGNVITWGEFGQPSQTYQPPGLSNVVAIAGINLCNVALKADGTVVAWGTDNGGGVTSIPADLRNVVSLAGGDYHCLALKSDGTVVGWGRDWSGQVTVPPGLSNVVAVSAGGNQSLALKADGEVVAWGSITTAKGNVVAGLTNVVLVANGSGHGLALGNLRPQLPSRNFSGLAGPDVTVTLQGSDADGDTLRYRVTTLPATGSLYQWNSGGRGSLIITNNTWVEDSGGRILYAQPSAGSESFNFVVNDRLVDSTNATASITISAAWLSTQPTRPAGTSAAILSGTAMAALPTTVWFEWGLAGGYGQRTTDIALTGDGTLTQFSTLVTSLTERVNYQCRLVASNASGVVHGAPVMYTTGRRAVAWGRNNFSQTNVPASLSNVVSVAAGVNHSLALKSDGSVVAWGFGDNGETNVPAGLADVVAVDGGANHSLALKADGTVAAWGLGSSGQTNIPTGLSNVIAVAAGYFHSLALRSDGTLAAWGANTYNQFPSGQTNIPPGLSNVVSVAAGGGHNLALKADGTVVAWGANSSGQINVPAGLNNIIAVAAGREHSLALKANGLIVGWGSSRSLQTTVPVSVSNAVAVAAGENQSLALRADGWAAAWGGNQNAFGQGTIPAGLSNVVALSAGGFHNVALGNLPPQAHSQTNVGLVAQELALTLTAGDPNYDTLTYRVASLPVAGTLYQWTPTGRGPAITTPNAVVDDAQGRIIFAPGSSSEGWPYSSFSFVANDGEADSQSALVTINLIPALVIEINGLAIGTNGEFSFHFNGVTNASYRVWASTNLTSWSVLGYATQSPPGVFGFADTTATNWSRRFYRVTIP